MKEIDFIPEWYKADQVRKRRYMSANTLSWRYVCGDDGLEFCCRTSCHHVSAEVEDIQAAFETIRDKVDQAPLLQSEIAEMKQKSAVLDKIEPRTKITAILGELSYLVQENIILNRLSLTE